MAKIESRLRWREAVAVAMGAIAVVALAGCGSDSSPVQTGNTASGASIHNAAAPSSFAASPSASAVDPITSDGTFELRDSAGYQLQVQYALHSSEPVIDPSSQPPGKTLVVIPGSLEVTVSNETPSREAILDPLYLAPYNVFPRTSLPCRVVAADDRPYTIGKTCLVPLGAPVNWELENTGGQTQLAPNGSMTASNASTMDNPLSQAAIVTSEDQASALVEALQHPSQVVLVGGATGTPQGRWLDTNTCIVTVRLFEGTVEWPLYGADGAPFCKS